MPHQPNHANIYEGMFTFNLNQTSEPLSSNIENSKESLSNIPDNNSLAAPGNSNLSCSLEMIYEFLAVIKTNYMSIKWDEGITTWVRVADELKDTI